MISWANTAKAFLAAIILAATTLLILPSNPEKAIAEKVLERGRDAIEAGNLKATMSRVSLAYHDDFGFNHHALRGSFGYTFSEFKNITVDYRVIGFRTLHDTCTVELDVRVQGLWSTANQITCIAGTDNAYEKVFIVCKKESGRWIVVSTKWPDRKDRINMFRLSTINLPPIPTVSTAPPSKT